MKRILRWGLETLGTVVLLVALAGVILATFATLGVALVEAAVVQMWDWARGVGRGTGGS